ncbi:MAG: hypothetical protein FWD37_00335 [Methanomassiliicoccaceae archaeon]|nr:hypothetical protein [Methanomassiliicoccaceae archaeon]
MEYNHMEELGFSEDKQLVCNMSGFLDQGRSMRNMCDRFIRNGGRLYDVLTACDSIMMYTQDDENTGSDGTLRSMAAFLKAYGVTDISLNDFFKNDIKLMQGSDVIHYLDELMTVTVLSETYEHHVSVLCDLIEMPYNRVKCTQVSFDGSDLEVNDAKWLREVAEEISKMDIPKITTSGTNQYLEQKDQMIIETVGRMTKRISKKVFARSVGSMGGSEKSHALLDAGRRTNVNYDCTAYIGTNATDHIAMDVVRSNEGLAISFNGDGYAVKGSNVAVMSSNSIVPAVLVSEFYINGLEAVYSMIGSWDRKELMRRECSDKNLMNAMLAAFPSKLPEVVIVDDNNLNDVMRESERYRRKLTI